VPKVRSLSHIENQKMIQLKTTPCGHAVWVVPFEDLDLYLECARVRRALGRPTQVFTDAAAGAAALAALS
jgi:hypothetical protein